MKQRATSTLRRLAGLAIASLVADPLAACSSASPALPLAPSSATKAAASADSASRLDSDALKLLYVSDNLGNKVYVYNAAATTQNPSPMRTITDGLASPEGITTDESGNLFVANAGRFSLPSSVTEYAPNASTPKATITSGVTVAVDVKVDKFGSVYVANNPYNALPYVDAYPKGSLTPTETWYSPTAGAITAIALVNSPTKGRTSVYALMNNTNASGPTGELLSCSPGESSCKSLSYTLGLAGGIAVVHSPSKKKALEFLAVDEELPGIDTFVGDDLASQEIIHGPPSFIALDSKESDLFVSIAEGGSVNEYRFPSYRLANTFTPPDDVTYGVTTYPAGTYH
jgi:hypothetical protein